jgi:hypothetical protein
MFYEGKKVKGKKIVRGRKREERRNDVGKRVGQKTTGGGQ